MSAFWESLAWMAKMCFRHLFKDIKHCYLPGYSALCVWLCSFLCSSELKPVVPAHTPSLCSAGIPFKGAVWSLLHDVLDFLNCKSHHTFGFPAEFFLYFVQSHGSSAAYSEVSNLLNVHVCFFKICASKSKERSFWYGSILTCGLVRNNMYVFINSTAMDDPPRPPMDSTRSLEMSGYMPCRGDFDMVRYWIYC